MSSILVVMVYLACTDPNPKHAEEGAKRKPLECVITSAEARQVPEAEAKAFQKWCEASDVCVEKRTYLFLLHAVGPAVVERKI